MRCSCFNTLEEFAHSQELVSLDDASLSEETTGVEGLYMGVAGRCDIPRVIPAGRQTPGAIHYMVTLPEEEEEEGEPVRKRHIV